ncbi:MAG: hypothetical protein P8169_13205, partial [Chloroflexota bacterium]
MFKKLSLLTVLAIFALLFVACGGGAAEAPQVEEAEATTVVEAEAPAEEPTAEEMAAEEPAAEEMATEEPAAEEAATEEPGETEGPAPAQGADTLAEVQGRGILNCG